MPVLLLCAFRFVRLLMSGHQAVAVENAALRLQLAAFRRKAKRPLLTARDWMFWIALRRCWSDWRIPLVYVQPDTVTRWQRERFRKFWARLSGSHHRRPGRRATAVEIRRLIERMAAANPLWCAPRIHGELKMLGIAISERTVSRIIRALRRPPTQTWKAFLHNHMCQTVSIDYFTLPTITMRVLFVFIVLEHGRRKVLHFNATEHPTAAWTSQQIREAFADRQPAHYAIRDRDGVYGNLVRECIASLGMEEVLTAPHSPWQNPYAERLVGTLRRECLNHFVIFNARHLRRTLALYFGYYHASRTHLGLAKQCPFAREILRTGRIVEIPQIGGLHHRYERLVA